jgi:capsular polysaccharide biosynthesis protein
MDFYTLLALFRRQKLTIIVITLATIVAATVTYFVQPVTQIGTLLFSVGVAESSQIEQGIDATKLADDFAHTVSGWTRSPTFSEKVGALAESQVTVTSEVQAKQNLLVFLHYKESKTADRAVVAVKQVFEEEMSKYNTRSKFKFFLSSHGESQTDTKVSLGSAIAVALALGIFLSLLWITIQAHLGGKISSQEEAEKILGVAATAFLHKPEKDEFKFLDVILKKIGSQVLLVGIDANLEKIEHKLRAGTKTFTLPKDAEILGKSHPTVVAVVKLDTSRATTLQELRSAVDGEIKLIVWS